MHQISELMKALTHHIHRLLQIGIRMRSGQEAGKSFHQVNAS